MTNADVCELAEKVLLKALRMAADEAEAHVAHTWMHVAEAASTMASQYEETPDTEPAGP